MSHDPSCVNHFLVSEQLSRLLDDETPNRGRKRKKEKERMRGFRTKGDGRPNKERPSAQRRGNVVGERVYTLVRALGVCMEGGEHATLEFCALFGP
ncbi:hypothetical protein WN55_08093 [Dufourea novaeangliae]|uniref:Uncharacterized protein n=1 Tax=Dufourea novaeangliae TaxID=178035 RepID=A0A154P7F3_DUFNO|nr:hypothetical protein WN55_08093 [Dufourea novaeangliae]